MKIGDRVTLQRAQYTCGGMIERVEDGETIVAIAGIGRERLAQEAGLTFSRGIVVAYNHRDEEAIGGPVVYTARAVLLQDNHERWWDVFGRQVLVTMVKPPERSSSARTNEYPD